MDDQGDVEGLVKALGVGGGERFGGFLEERMSNCRRQAFSLDEASRKGCFGAKDVPVPW